MNLKGRRWMWKDYAAFIAAMAGVGGIIYATIFLPHGTTNFGFGPDWECLGKGICAKKKPSP